MLGIDPKLVFRFVSGR